MFLSPCFADQSSTYLLPDKTDISPSYSRSSSLIWESICGALDRISLFLQINYKRYFNGKSQSKSRKSKLPKEILCSVYRKQTCMKHNTDAKISFWLLFFLLFITGFHIFLCGMSRLHDFFTISIVLDWDGMVKWIDLAFGESHCIESLNESTISSFYANEQRRHQSWYVSSVHGSEFF